MSKFAADEQLEKDKEMERLRRRDEYKAGMEAQVKQRQDMYERAKAADEVARQQALEKEAFRAQVVEEARKRLIAEHAANLREFLPKGVLLSNADLELLKSSPRGNGRADARTLARYGDTLADAQAEERDREKAFERLKAEQAETKRKLR